MTSVVRVVRLFEALPAPTRGISWMAFATFFKLPPPPTDESKKC